jgi:hypothetical protein
MRDPAHHQGPITCERMLLLIPLQYRLTTVLRDGLDASSTASRPPRLEGNRVKLDWQKVFTDIDRTLSGEYDKVDL